MDGAARVKDLVNQAKSFGMTAIALTDHGTMYGTIDFYKAAVSAGIKPIIGCEVYVAPESRFIRSEIDGEKYYHLVLLAENNEGYKNLVKLVSIAATEGFYYKPRVDKGVLRKYHEGIIALSACISGEIPKAILNDDFSRAIAVAKEYVEIFGRDNFFLEIQNHRIEDKKEEEKKVRDALIKISSELDIGLVATNDSHYVRREDSELRDVLLCIQMSKTLDDANNMRFFSDEYYLKSPEDMRTIFSENPDACDNTLKIAERCNVTFEFGKLQMPEYPLPKNYTDAAQYLHDLCYQKVYERYSLLTDEISSRLDYELDVIKKMGYDGYFLIVWNFIDYAKKKKIAIGPGRGSAAGSIVSYILGITDLDPLEFNLLFERFLNPERVSMPDIDVDFCYMRREEVIEYVKKTYGEDHVAQIVTFGTMAAKASLRDVFRVFNIPYSESSRIVAMIPNEPRITLDKALQTSKELRHEYNNNFITQRVIDLARKLEGLPRHASVHAAGIVISKLPLTNYVPVQISNSTLVTQYDKDKIEELGLLKMDFLGLRTLTIINEAIDNIKATSGIEIKIEKIPLNDKLTAQMLSDGKTGAVFQMESSGMTKLVRDLKPECFADLIPTVALYRPGPLGSGMVEDFIDGKHGRREPNYLHPKLEPILKETFGVVLYQEQVMQIVQALAGFSLGQADLLRRAMGKKNASILMAQRENFLKGCASNGIDDNLAEKIFELLAHFADYGFNKSHSAAYALVAWRTAYLKAHYPAEFMAAMLSSVMDSDKIAHYVELTKKMGIKILPADINESGAHFQVQGDAIRYALSAVKNVGEPAVENIVEVRGKSGKFRSLVDFCCRVALKNFSKRGLENLIKCGAFDCVDSRRTAVFKSLNSAFSEGSRKSKDDAFGQTQLFSDIEIEKTVYMVPNVKEKPKIEILAWEKEALGFYMTGHPLDEFENKFSDLIKINKIKAGEFKVGKRVKVGGLITNARQITTRKGELMAFLTLEDFRDSLNVTVFPAVFSTCVNLILPDEAIVVDGKIDFTNNEFQILAEKIIGAEEYEPEIFLIVPAQIENQTTINRLSKLFEEHAGKTTVNLNRFGRWRRLKAGVEISNGDKFSAELKNLLGAENVKFY